VSEQGGYHLSQSEDYDLSAQGRGYNDMRLSSQRHSACYACYDDCLDAPAYRFGDQYVGRPKDTQKLARNRISISVLRVCRQVYVESAALEYNNMVVHSCSSVLTVYGPPKCGPATADAETALGPRPPLLLATEKLG
jgi:hypothetical protein